MSKITSLQQHTYKNGVDFPKTLPITAHVDEIIAAIKQHSVIVVAGETGSGKSTQLAKICLHAGYGQTGFIAHTQPRRIAARTIADRIASELKSSLGDRVGYRVRFEEKVSSNNVVRVMTDGMLLAEYQSDPLLSRYEVIIIDEAHERSLNIDFLLGLLKLLCRKRPDIKVIVTSATLDQEKFAQYFSNAPLISVSGRTYPVEVRYREIEANTKTDNDALNESILASIQELFDIAPGNTLVFLPGEREIIQAQHYLQKKLKRGLQILPLYARLNAKAQGLVFARDGRTKIILSTNVAETSLTVPGIKYVIDTGLARISRYSPSRKIQRLPIERISQASANQRAGRCGRVAAGICIRLFDEADFLSRPEYTDAEILRTSLADVILKMAVMRLGEINKFPFLDAPSRQQVNDGLAQLFEIGAIDKELKLTPLGRKIAQIPVDPRIARMLLEAAKLNCLRDMVVLAAVLTVGEPKVTPADQRELAQQKHRALSKETSDFMVYLDIWSQFLSIQKTASNRKAWQWCDDNFLSRFRMREWRTLQANLWTIIKSSKSFKLQGTRQSGDESNVRQLSEQKAHEVRSEAVHRALLSGMITQVAMLYEHEQEKKFKSSKKKVLPTYVGTWNKKLAIFPGSVAFKSRHKWIMAAQFVETSALYAREVAAVSPQWIEHSAAHLIRFEYSDPYWDKRSERVMAYRRGILFGLTVYSGRKCDYTAIDKAVAREIFILQGLVNGQLKTAIDLVDHNLHAYQQARQQAEKLRRMDMIMGQSDIADFYQQYLPEWIISASDFRRWLKNADRAAITACTLEPSAFFKAPQEMSELTRYFPDTLFKNNIQIPLHYRFKPGTENDGITAEVPVSLLNQMESYEIDRLVPGRLKEKMTALMKTLPKSLRLNFIPVVDYVDQIFDTVNNDSRELLQAMAVALNEIKSTQIQPEDFSPEKLPQALKMKIKVVDESKKTLAVGDDLEVLKAQFVETSRQTFNEYVDEAQLAEGLTQWNFGDISHRTQVKINGQRVPAFAALVDHQAHVDLSVFDREDEALAQHYQGQIRLFQLQYPEFNKYLIKQVPDWKVLQLRYARIGATSDLASRIVFLAIEHVCFADIGYVWQQQVFTQRYQQNKQDIYAGLREFVTLLKEILTLYAEVAQRLEESEDSLNMQSLSDIEEQLDWLVYDGFFEEMPMHWLRRYPVYLKAMIQRIEQALLNPVLDIDRLAKLKPHWQRFLNTEREYDQQLLEYRFLLEEYRLSLFTQSVKTVVKISPARLDKFWQDIN